MTTKELLLEFAANPNLTFYDLGNLLSIAMVEDDLDIEFGNCTQQELLVMVGCLMGVIVALWENDFIPNSTDQN